MAGPLAARRALLLRLYEAAVGAAHPRLFLPPLLPVPPARGRLILLGAGKAAGSMTEVAEAHYLALGLEPGRLTGIAVARHGYERATARVPVVPAGHPVPDEAGLEGTRRALAFAADAGPDDLVLVLLSGGGSANWTAPAPGVTFADKQAVTRALLRSGAPIGDINAVRKHLSRIKGGRLARAAARSGRLLTLAVSDVPGDDPSTIASGPTVPDPTSLGDARAALARWRVEPPTGVGAALLDPANESPKPGDPAFARAELRIAVRPRDALEAAAVAARAAGYEPVLLGADVEGEARDVARDHAAQALALKRSGRRAALLSGGELTVTIGGRGRGGPNQEYALALGLALAGEPGIAALAADTDGTDGGGGGAGDPAGALLDETSLARAASLGLDPAGFLTENDSTGFFERLGDLVTPGPTFTNVNDLRAILIDP